MMKLIYASILLFNVVISGEKDVKKSSSRDVNDAVSGPDYALSKIPVYLIPNGPLSEGRIPVAVIPGAYPPATFYAQSAAKEAKPHKYGFYAPYKTPEVTPIHEPQSEGYGHAKFSQAYALADLNQKSDYNENPSYKVSVIGKDYQTSTSFVKYETTPKNILEKHQSLSNGNIYASLAPVLGYSNTDQSAIGYAVPKKLPYEYQQHQAPQYYIKYVPVPYAVPQDQYQDTAYITPKPYAYKAPKRPAQAQEVEASTAAYAYSDGAYQDAKYAASYAPAEESYQYPEYKYVQPSAYKYYDKNVYAKKYVPTSYLVATIGKGGSTHYASNIQHDSYSGPSHEPSYAKYNSPSQEPSYAKYSSPSQEPSYKLGSSLQDPYTTKLAPVPLPVEKYVVQDSQSPEENKYTENGYAYVYPSTSTNTKYKPLFTVPQYQYDYAASPHYHKKDVQSVSSTKSYESSTSKL